MASVGENETSVTDALRAISRLSFSDSESELDSEPYLRRVRIPAATDEPRRPGLEAMTDADTTRAKFDAAYEAWDLHALILASKAPRIVNVSSDGHRFRSVRFDDPNFQNGKVYDQWEAYGQSKTSSILFTKALAKKLGPKGLKVYSLHPGQSMGTSLAPQGFSDEDMATLVAKDKEIGWDRGFDWKTLDECAATHVAAAFDPRLDDFNGAYLEDGNLSDDVQPTAKKPEDVEELWKLSEKLVGETFNY